MRCVLIAEHSPDEHANRFCNIIAKEEDSFLIRKANDSQDGADIEKRTHLFRRWWRRADVFTHTVLVCV